MAINASANWYVRAGGNALNGGGWDAAIAGAGVNYCDQDAAQLSLTDFATSGAGSTTLTSATGGFTAAMVGNCVRIASGTNFQAGYYFLTSYTNTNTVGLDRTPSSGGAGSGGTGRIGGAFANCAASLSTGGSVTAPAITSPLAAGHTINVRGGGTDTPASADYTQAGYATYPAGSLAAGMIRVVGYNGRPRIDCTEMVFHACTYWSWENLMLKATAATNPTYGMISDAYPATIARNVRVDQAGFDRPGIRAQMVVGCSCINSGSTTAGTYPAIEIPASGGFAVGNYVNGWRGYGISTLTGLCSVSENIVANCKRTTSPGIRLAITSSTFRCLVEGNTVYSNAGDGIGLIGADSIQGALILNNILYGNGGYGISASVGALALNDRTKSLIDYNAFRSNTSGALNAISAGSHDVTLTGDPFTNAASADFTLNSTAGAGAALKGVAFPGTFPS